MELELDSDSTRGDILIDPRKVDSYFRSSNYPSEDISIFVIANTVILLADS